jgi:siroheme decarboxylase
MKKNDIDIIRALQDEDIYLELDPFQRVAERLGLGCDELLERVGELKEAGVIRRFGAAMTPHKAGFTSNAMVTWEVEPERENEAAGIMAAHPRVSHCYLRDGFEGFPYTLYTMTHASSPEDLEAILDEMAEEAGVRNRRVLKSVKEYKKSSPVYFPEKKGS